jgi:hypothetical protein
VQESRTVVASERPVISQSDRPETHQRVATGLRVQPTLVCRLW